MQCQRLRKKCTAGGTVLSSPLRSGLDNHGTPLPANRKKAAEEQNRGWGMSGVRGRRDASIYSWSGSWQSSLRTNSCSDLSRISPEGDVKHTLTCDLRNNHSVLSHLRVLPDDSRGGTLHIPFVETSHLSTHLRNHRVGVSKLRRKLLFQGAVGVLA